MKSRLQKLWDEVLPDSGLCPQPDMKQVRRRVDAVLDGRPRILPRRMLALSIVTVAATLLLVGTALAGVELIPPEFNVLSSNFPWGGNYDLVIDAMTVAPVSVDDENYTLTATSSLADGYTVYFTLVIEPKNGEARERLYNAESHNLLSYRIPRSYSNGFSAEYDAETGAMLMDVSASWKPAKSIRVRLNLMDEGIWLDIPVKTVRSLTLKINAEAQGTGSMLDPTGGPLKLKTVELSPLSCAMDYTATKHETYPVVYFLFKDGAVNTMSQMGMGHPSGNSSSRLFNKNLIHFKLRWQFGAVQDLSLIEAFIFGDMAYPLDGSEPYEVDIDTLLQSFVIPSGGLAPGRERTVPLFALCDGLGADCQWDETTGVAVASFRDTTLTFTVGSTTVQVDGQWSRDSFERDAAPVYWDGELWVDAASLFRSAWKVGLQATVEDLENSQIGEDGSVIFTSWLVTP